MTAIILVTGYCKILHRYVGYRLGAALCVMCFCIIVACVTGFTGVLGGKITTILFSVLAALSLVIGLMWTKQSIMTIIKRKGVCADGEDSPKYS
jgi:hypothetical protein